MILFATIYESIWRSGFKGLLFCNLNSFRHRILDLCTYQSTCLVISGYHFQEYIFEIQNASLQNVFIDWNAIFLVLNLAMTEANYIRSISKKKTIHFDLDSDSWVSQARWELSIELEFWDYNEILRITKELVKRSICFSTKICTENRC